MAVEAHHLLHAGGPAKLTAAHAGWEAGGALRCDATPASGPLASYYGIGRDTVSAGRQSQQAHRHQQLPSSCVGIAAAPASAPMMIYGGQAESDVTFGGAQAQDVACGNRKRKRAADQSQFLGFGAPAQQQQQLVLDVDRIVLQHTAKMRAELAEQRRRHVRQVVAAVEAGATKRLRAKDEEIARLGRLNWALEERVRSLSVEAQVWRDMAHSNEAAAGALRGELQQALDAQARRGVAQAADDAASCCCGENDGAGDDEEVATATRGGMRCAVCGEGAAEVLLLPCRHLCACAACAAVARACPACGCAKNGSVCVNFSASCVNK